MKAFLSLVFALGALSPVLAGTDQASATMTSSIISGGFQYDITLDNTGTNNLGTFWYSWVPGKDFMPSAPTLVDVPTGWTDTVTHAGAGDGFAIQWVAGSTAALTPGSTLNFIFDSTATPATMAGDSSFFPTFPIGTSFVYNGAPFSDAGFQFDVASLPEPSTWALLLPGGLAVAYAFLRHLKYIPARRWA
jgi:hypothetical protein